MDNTTAISKVGDVELYLEKTGVICACSECRRKRADKLEVV